MTETALVVTNPQLPDVMTLGKVLAQSGYFSDARQAGQAVVKILAGQELGFGPIASMTGVHIIKSKVSLSANLMAAAIKRSGRYTYDVTELTEQTCTITFKEGAKTLGESTFTMKDAAKAKLVGDNWKKYPRNMLFARALSNGTKWYTPDIFGGPIYTPDELGAVIDGETGEVISNGPDWDKAPGQDAEPAPDHKPQPPAPKQKPKHKPQKTEPSTNGRPLDAETIRATIRKKAGWQSDGLRLVGEPITEKQIGIVARLVNDALGYADGEMQDKLRYEVYQFLVGVDGTKKLTKLEASAIIDWLKVADENDWSLNAYAQREVTGILEQAGRELGQQELELPY